MLLLIAAWFWPATVVFQYRNDLSGLVSLLLTDGLFGIGLMGVITTVVCVFVFADSFDNMGDISGILTAVGFAVDVLFLVSGIFVNQLGAIFTWFQTNGLRLNLIYLAALFLIVLFNVMAGQAKRSGKPSANLMGSALAENQAPAGVRKSNQIQLTAWVLLPPSVVVAMFTGVPGLGECSLKPLPYSEWAWGAQVALIGFLLVLAKFLVLQGFIRCDWAQVWSALALVGNMAALGFGYLVLKAALMSLTSLTYLLIFPVEFGLYLYSYLFLLYCVIDLLSFGAYSAALKERREWKAEQARRGSGADESAAYEKKLDGRERVLNAFLGRGPLTDEQAYLMNEMDTKEYVDSELLRQKAIDRHNRKHNKE